MKTSTDLDYSTRGLTIQQAMVDLAKKHPDKKTRPKNILWSGYHVQTSDALIVPKEGVVRLEFLSSSRAVRQGVDIRVDGYFELAAGERVPLLRIWKDERYNDAVEYSFYSKDGWLWTWNVYEMTYPSGESFEEKWTENAGFWVETIGEFERVYYCSHGMASPPDFDSLIFKLSVKAR